MHVRFILALWSAVVAAASPSCLAADDAPLAWPPITRECRPWAYNWWLGSAVDRTNLAHELQRYREGGLGGVHIVPIYGAKGAESRYLDYLGPGWMDMLGFAVSEGVRHDLGVDMTTGTGWCFGGPNVTKAQGGWTMRTRMIAVPAGGKLDERFDRQTVQALIAVSGGGERVDLKPLLDKNGSVSWDSAGKAWDVCAVTATPGGPAVKRAAPGGAGPMLNPFDPAAMAHYLERFTEAFAGHSGPRPRAMYHDSFEYNSLWTPALLEEFAKRRGYRLEDRLAEFCESPRKSAAAARVWGDFRETVSDLMIEDVFPRWTRWSREHGFLTRNQAHGSPGNLLDLYALADIPETEMFGRGTRDPLRSAFDERFHEGDRLPLISKFASSAAHVAGRKLVAAETGTWMAEHFCETLEEMKCFVDLLLLSGVNHVFYHGCCYSPDDAAWPGWLFYASTQMNPRNAIWRDAPALNHYIARCQAVLQAGAPDHDVLLYWPIHDLWQTAPGTLVKLTVHQHGWLDEQPLGDSAMRLWSRGYGFDYVSDRQLADTRAAEGKLRTAGGEYRVVVVPPTTVMPLETLRQLLALAEAGGTVIFEHQLPTDVPGLARLDERRTAFRKLLEPLAAAAGGTGLRLVKLGAGRVFVGDLESALASAGVRRETLVDHAGTQLIRRRHERGRHYFIANQGTQVLAGWQTLATAASAAVILDPMTGRSGVAPLRRTADGQPQVRLRLEPGHSIIVRTFNTGTVSGSEWQFAAPAKEAMTLPGPWTVRFIEGGPVLPKPYETAQLGSWTGSGDLEAGRFAGTAAYSTHFDAPAGSGPWLLDLGRVCHSARVRLNGQDLGTVLMEPYRVTVAALKPTGNQLEIEVTNLSANRIRDLDRRKVPWRIFHEINLVNIRYKPFNAAGWPVFDSGLSGPVRLLETADVF